MVVLQSLLILIGVAHVLFNERIALRTAALNKRYSWHMDREEGKARLKRDRILTVVVGTCFIFAGLYSILA